MQRGSNDAHGGQRSAFARLMAARRVSDSSATHAASPSTLSTTKATTTASPTVRLPTIARSSGLTPASAPVPSSSHHRGSDSSNNNTTAPSSSSYVISERTPRAELLAIIGQLQTDLSQRTDSVNAIQRNFQRLSAMHRAEQDELQRLRQLLQERQDVSRTMKDADAAEQRRVMEELKTALQERQDQCTRLQEEIQTVRARHEQALGLSAMMDSDASERQGIVSAAFAEHEDLVRAAAVEWAQLVRAGSAENEQQQRHAQLLRVLHVHIARLNAVTQVANGHTGTESASAHLTLDTDAESVVPNGVYVDTAVTAALQRAEEVARTNVVARENAANERLAAAATAAAQHEESAASLRMCELQRALRATLTMFEERERCSLKTAAADTLATLFQAYQDGKEVVEGRAQLVSATQAHLMHTTSKCSERVDSWVASAEQRLQNVESLFAMWRLQCEGDFAAQREALQQQQQRDGQEAHDLAAARAEWESLRDTERKTHRAELAHVRQDTAAKVATAESRWKAAQQQCLTLQRALNDARATHQHDSEEAERRAQERAKEAAAEREALLSRQWFRVQSAQEARTAELIGLLWSALCAREGCLRAELQARTILYQNYVQAAAVLSQGAVKAEAQVGATQALWTVREAHAGEAESAAREQVAANEREEFVQLKGEEQMKRHHTQHRYELQQLRLELQEAQTQAAEAEAQRHSCVEQLTADLHHAQEEHCAALDRAADATDAAQAAHRAEKAALEQLRDFKASTAAAAQRIEAAESATESACCCSLCLQLLHKPVACVPCGHVYCAGCLLWHPRNKTMSSLTASALPSRGRRDSEPGQAVCTEVEVVQWMRGLRDPHTRLYCPECGTASVSSLVELPLLGELAAKYTYKKAALLELMRELH